MLNRRHGQRGFDEAAFEHAVEELVRYSWKAPYDGSREAEDTLGRWVSRRITEAQEATRLRDPGLFGFDDGQSPRFSILNSTFETLLRTCAAQLEDRIKA